MTYMIIKLHIFFIFFVLLLFKKLFVCILTLIVSILFFFQVASELNAAILDVDSTPKLANLLKLLLWAQEELDKKKVKYPKLVDLAKGDIDYPK